MYLRRLLGRFLAVLILIQTFSHTSISHHKEVASAAGEVFLSSPYYGNEFITSWFDHRLPTYTDDGNLLKYTGEELPDPWPGENQCNWITHDNCYDGHNGIDFALNYERVLAAANGIVTKASWWNFSNRNSSYGLTIEIEHDVNGVKFYSLYGHLSSVAVHVGQFVYSGMVIGTSGNTGSSSGAHLHFSIFILEDDDWKVIDPFGWKPVPGADVTMDPWSLSASGTESWCMWARGEWVRHCSDYPEFYPVTTIPDPAITLSLSENVIVVEDSLINNNTFSKGYGGLWLNPCNNLDPTCRDWFDSLAGSGGHTLRTFADGVETIDNWAKWKPGLPSNYSDIYEIFVYVPDIPGYTDDTFTWQAKYKVVDGNGTTYEAIVDQYTGDKWLSIGSYYLVGTSNTSYVYLTDATGEEGDTHCLNGPIENNQHWCRLTVDAVKFVKLGVRYAPDISASIPGRFSEVVLNNPSLAPARYKVSFFDAAGTYCGGVWNPAVPSQGHVVVFTECPTAAYAVVSANRDLAVVVEHADLSGPSYSYNGIAALDSSNPGWGEIGEPMNLPIIIQNYWTWYSFGFVLNPSSSTVWYETRYTKEDGEVSYAPWYFLFPNEQYPLPPWPYAQQNKLYSAMIDTYEDKPLAVVVKQQNSTGTSIQTYNAFTSGSTETYAPIIMNNYYGWVTSVNVQNLDSHLNNITIVYNGDPENPIVKNHSIPGYASASYYSPAQGLNFTVGSAVITSAYPVAVVVNQSTSTSPVRSCSYSASQIGSDYVLLPDIVHKSDFGGNQDWVSSVNLQNVGYESEIYHIRFRTASGSLALYNVVEIQPGGWFSLYIPNFLGPTSWRGHGEIWSIGGEPVVVVVNQSASIANGDMSRSYQGVNR